MLIFLIKYFNFLTMAGNKWVYNFGDGEAEGDKSLKNLLGGKGANLAEMCSNLIPVPAGFTVTTEVCTEFYKHAKQYPPELASQVASGISHIEKVMGAEFGGEENPLLVSVRSGARASMPGMMDTILNLGLNDATAEALAKKTGNARFAYDSYRRFIQMYGDVVLDIDHYYFEEYIDILKEDKGITSDVELSEEDLKDLVAKYKSIIEQHGKIFPQNVQEQLWGAISAVFTSWMNDRAITYRRMYDIPEEWGTAVNVQAMVFGNMGQTSATGVAFTRDPSTGEKLFYGEYLINAQGEDVVAGIRTPGQITIKGKQAQASNSSSDMPAMEEVMPATYQELVAIYNKLEAHYKDMQDIEFTVQQGKLWILQTRNGKRTAKAALKIAVDMVSEGLITKQEAILRIEPDSLEQLLHPSLDKNAPKEIITKGLPASPGAGTGAVVFSSEEAEIQSKLGNDVILVRLETSPEDIHGMQVSKAILTARGGMTSHAAVVARGMGRACISGASAIKIDYKKKLFTCGNITIKEGDLITVDGSSGEVILGKMPTIEPDISGDFGKIMSWADEMRDVKVRTNAETAEDVRTALKFGAEGIGLCRTEHMFFDDNRIISVREMILARTAEARKKAIDKLLPYQQQDFLQIFKIMDGLPVNIRLLDPPLHEFLPHKESEIEELAKIASITKEQAKARFAELHEQNPMLGHRGCRLGISYPEIYEMQAKAIFKAAVEAVELGKNIMLEIMVPLIFSKKEMKVIKAIIDRVAHHIQATANIATNAKINYQIGTMIELPRAALRAEEIAQEAEYFSFGTNDLTQTTMGISRDDSGAFINSYYDNNIFSQDPFARLDVDGVGELIKIAIERGKKARPNIKLGICGEHGGDPSSIAFFVESGLDYVSCSAFRVPIARLATAQACLLKNRNQTA